MAPFSAKSIPSLKGKVIIVTGGNSGLGKESVLELARHQPERLYLTTRSASKAEAVIAQVKRELPNAAISHLEMDLSSFASIRKAADHFLANEERLDILMLNAAVMACPVALTEEGYEIQFGTNHMGHALFTKLLMPAMLFAAKNPENGAKSDVRVVILSSEMANYSPECTVQFKTLKTTFEKASGFERYGQSKLANLLYAHSLAKRYPQLCVMAVHPGGCATNLGGSMMQTYPCLKLLKPLLNLFLKKAATGARNQLWAATSDDAHTGQYYWPVGVAGKGGKKAEDTDLAEKLWLWTEDELQKHEC